MTGFYLGQNDSCLEKVAKKSEELCLLAKGDGTEVMKQKISAGSYFTISPGDNDELMEFFYVLDGKITYQCHDKNITINQGEYFYAHKLDEDLCLKAESNVTMLYISTQPLFHLLSNEIKELNEINSMIARKDIHTEQHNERVRSYCVRISKKINLSNEKFENLVFAAVYHDIGKINVPDEILLKPSALTGEEYELIKKHPVDGRKLVEKTYLRGIGKIIEQHHERLDGSGYPYGLKEDEICIEAKVVAILDSFDAMISDRPYRKGMAPNVAMEELKRLAGIHYDKKILEVFEEVLKEEGIL